MDEKEFEEIKTHPVIKSNAESLNNYFWEVPFRSELKCNREERMCFMEDITIHYEDNNLRVPIKAVDERKGISVTYKKKSPILIEISNNSYTFFGNGKLREYKSVDGDKTTHIVWYPDGSPKSISISISDDKYEYLYKNGYLDTKISHVPRNKCRFPSFVSYYHTEPPSVKTKIWGVKGIPCFRPNDLPNRIEYFPNGKLKLEEWLTPADIAHREDVSFPAIIEYDEKGNIISENYMYAGISQELEEEKKCDINHPCEKENTACNLRIGICQSILNSYYYKGNLYKGQAIIDYLKEMWRKKEIYPCSNIMNSFVESDLIGIIDVDSDSIICIDRSPEGLKKYERYGVSTSFDELKAISLEKSKNRRKILENMIRNDASSFYCLPGNVWFNKSVNFLIRNTNNLFLAIKFGDEFVIDGESELTGNSITRISEIFPLYTNKQIASATFLKGLEF